MARKIGSMQSYPADKRGRKIPRYMRNPDTPAMNNNALWVVFSASKPEDINFDICYTFSDEESAKEYAAKASNAWGKPYYIALTYDKFMPGEYIPNDGEL